MMRTGLAVILGSVLAVGAAQAQTGQGTQNPPTAQKPGERVGQETQKGAQAKAGDLAAAERQFLMEAAEGGLMEVELGKIAVAKAASADVKKFGQRMVDDHGKANQQLKALASKKNVTLPTAPAKHKAEIDRLSKLSGEEFDRAYMDLMVRDHGKDVKAFHQQAASAADPDVKKFAADTLPVLTEHSKEAERIHGQMKGGAAKKQ